MDQFFSVNVLQIVQLLALVGGGFWAVSALKTSQTYQAERLERVEIEVGELRKVVVNIARQEERMTAMDQRMMAQGSRIDAQGERLTSMDQRLLTATTQINEMLNRESFRRHGRQAET